MDVELVPGARIDHVLRVLNEAREALASVRNVGSNQAVDTFNAYVRWAGSHLPVLSSVITGPALDGLVTSRGYYLVHGVDPRALGQQLTHLVLSEVELRLRSFDAALADIRRSTTDVGVGRGSARARHQRAHGPRAIPARGGVGDARH